MLCAWLATHRLIPSDHPFLVAVAMHCPLTTSTDYACTEPCLLNDLNTVDSPPYSDQLFEATSVVTDENMFAIDDDAHGEEDNSASNKATEAAGVGLMYGDEQ